MTNKYVKRYSTSGIFREMIEKNHMRYHFMYITVDIIKTPEITNVGEDAEKL